MYPFDWYQYVLGILGGWMAGVYGGFTSSAEFIDGAQRISSHFILFTHSLKL
jgi:phospholipid/cholesterol/gamma-HCH transport system permease protein